MISSRALLTISLSFLSACATASGTFVPLGPDHPANALAPAAPITDPSAVLRAENAAAGFAEHHAAEPPAADAAAPAGAYVCPMHPEVTADAEGRCPKCGMKLVPRESQEQGAEEHPHVH